MSFSGGNGRRRSFFHSIKSRLLLLLLGMMLLFLCVNLFVFSQSRDMLRKIDRVFVSNVSMVELGDRLEEVQSSVYEYLNTRSSSALEDFYRSQQAYSDMVRELSDSIVRDKRMMLERNIRLMSEDYLLHAEQAVQAKRGRNVEEYRTLYEETKEIYGFIKTYIYELNSLRFRQNSEHYTTLLDAFGKLEVFSLMVILAVFIFSFVSAFTIIRDMISPLITLAGAANRVAEGDFEVSVSESPSSDEVGVVTNAFRKMLDSIRSYITRQRISLETEARMKEKELSMEAHLREAQLKYLQAQINPHFLFNCLNAGAQLSMLEGAEKTEDFLDRMADFFRYNVQKMEGNASLAEEISAVDNYIYILNVRFAGDIHYRKSIAADIDTAQIDMPSMILQPIVENAIQHGIREDLEKGRVELRAERIGGDENETGLDCICITVSDNGRGMSSADMQALGMAGLPSVRHGGPRDGKDEGPEGKAENMTAAGEGRRAHLEEDSGEDPERAFEKDSGGRSGNGNSTGIAIANVISRLELYYDEKNLFSIWSDGLGCGTEVTILLPVARRQRET